MFKDKKKLIIPIIIGAIILVPALILLLIPHKDNIEIRIVGDDPTKIEVLDEYRDDGIIVLNNNQKIKRDKYEIETTDNVDTKKIGTYEYKYYVQYKNKTYQQKREVIVEDNKAPIITSESSKIQRGYCESIKNKDIKYKAIDNYDGDITKQVEKEYTDNQVVLKVKDSSGNEGRIAIPVVVGKEPSPKMTLNGAQNMYLLKGNKYIEQSVEVKDGCGKKLDTKVSIDGKVDVSKKGTYKLTYSIKYKDFNLSMNRIVKIIDINDLETNGKTVYLTFDDGPGPYTKDLLDILDKYNVKATFFVTNQFPKYQNMIKEEAARGHTVAVHSLTHKWDIYNSLDAYLKDFNAMNDIIEQQTGVRATIFRFPGGSSNTVSKGHKKGVVTEIAKYMTNEGFVYFDWNVDSGDAAGAKTEKAYNNVINGIKNRESSVVLMHDIKQTSIPAVEQIILYGLANGYTFKALNDISPTVHHGIRN